jgi:hypothetical protein
VIGTDLHQLACPARFERATYALEALKMSRNNKLNNGFNLLTFGVVYTPRTMGLSEIAWIRSGIGRWSNGLKWDLSGKPTFSSAPNRCANSHPLNQ